MGDATHGEEIESQVLVVGAGPVGLALAIELGLRGIRTLVVEERDGQPSLPKMSQVSTRSLEFCRRWGIAERVIDAGWPKSHPMDFVYVTSMTGHELYRRRVPSYAEQPAEPFSPTRSYQCPQIFFDPVLRDFCRTIPSVSLRFLTRLESFTERADHVQADLVDAVTGRRWSCRASYLAGCDGGQSLVRERLGIGMSGGGRLDFSVSIFFRSAALGGLHDKGWARFYRLVDQSGHWADLVAIDGKELWRLTILTGLAPSDLERKSFDSAAYLERAAGTRFDYEILSVMPWERRELIADRYGKGRVYIAGDAAHQNSPTGGLGMNTGLGDAVDLGWKLAATIAGWGGEDLLESYEIERRPTAQRNVVESTRLFRNTTALPGGNAVNDPSLDGDAARAAIRGVLEADARAGTMVISENIRLGYCYEDSPVILGDGMPSPRPEGMRFAPSARPGTRAPHGRLADGRSMLDLFGDGFVLLRLGDFSPDAAPLVAAAARRGVPVRVEHVTAADIAALYEFPLVLVRPDGHVAWRGKTCPAEPLNLIDRVRGAATVTDRAEPATARMQQG